MNLQFNTEKEKRAFELLRKYFNEDVEKHILEVEQLYSLATSNGYTEVDIKTDNSIDAKKEYLGDGRYVKLHIILLKTIIQTQHTNVEIKYEIESHVIEKLIQTPAFEKTKIENNSIMQQNAEVEELLNIVKVLNWKVA